MRKDLHFKSLIVLPIANFPSLKLLFRPNRKERLVYDSSLMCFHPNLISTFNFFFEENIVRVVLLAKTPATIVFKYGLHLNYENVIDHVDCVSPNNHRPVPLRWIIGVDKLPRKLFIFAGYTVSKSCFKLAYEFSIAVFCIDIPNLKKQLLLLLKEKVHFDAVNKVRI